MSTWVEDAQAVRRTDVSPYEPGNAIAVFALFCDAAEYKAWKCLGPQFVITAHPDGYAIRKLMPVLS